MRGKLSTVRENETIGNLYVKYVRKFNHIFRIFRLQLTVSIKL